MSKRYVLSEYVELAMGQAIYDKRATTGGTEKRSSLPEIVRQFLLA